MISSEGSGDGGELRRVGVLDTGVGGVAYLRKLALSLPATRLRLPG